MKRSTLLLVPGPPPSFMEQRALELAPDAYRVGKASPDVWVVQVAATGRQVYRGPGPAMVLLSPVPF